MMKKPLSTPLPPYTLRAERVDVYCFSLNKPLTEREIKSLSDDELARANRFHFKHHQLRFKCARARLRETLAKYLNTQPNTLVFDYGKQGKPYLPAHQSLQFNLSHSGEIGLLAIGKNHPIGIDIERFSERPYLGIGQHMFSESENKQLSARPNSLKPLTFFSIWAQKEAFIKRTGLGLSYPTHAFDVLGLSRKAYVIPDKKHQTQHKMLPFMPHIGYAAALCCDPSIETIRYIADRQLERNEKWEYHFDAT